MSHNTNHKLKKILLILLAATLCMGIFCGCLGKKKKEDTGVLDN